MGPEALRVAAAFASVRWGPRPRDRAALLARQRRQLERFLARNLPRSRFYRGYAGRPLADLPVVDKETVLGDFAAFNRHGIPLERALAVALAAEASRDFRPTLDGLTVGLSSGTSGRRGVFLVSPRERARWAGTLLAQLLTPASLAHLAHPFRPPLRVAFFLRANSNLYTTLASRRLEFAWFDLREPLDPHLDRLRRRSPDVLAGPPSLLRRLAEETLAGALPIAPRQVVAVAETLEPDDERAIRAAYGVPVAQVYQAAEGLLGVSCPAGRIHLDEERLVVEDASIPYPASHSPSVSHYFHPVITDVSRTTQLVVRYRLDDVLLAAPDPCPCGLPTRSLGAVLGRADDVFWLPRRDSSGLIPIFPDVLRAVLAAAGDGVADYRLEQDGRRWRLRLVTPDPEAAARRIGAEIERLCAGLGAVAPELELAPWVATPPGEKRRRLRRLADPAPAAAESR